MAAHRSDYLNVLKERGFFQDATDLGGLDQLLSTETVTGYIGFDATAPSLHVGSLTQIMLLYWLQQCGHRPIVLMGGGTTKVGDPTGKDAMRKVISDETIAANLAGIKKAFASLITFGDGPSDAVMVNNDDWLSGLAYIPFLRDVGRFFSVNRMLTMESVKQRLGREQPMSFLEFNYMILQAYDFVELNKRYGCRLQIGGSDQWGNIVMGTDLGRRMGTPELFGLTTPLLTTADGKKMGKTEQGAAWIDPEMMGAYDFWQFWRNTADADVPKLLSRFTLLPMEEVRRLSALEGAELNEAKKILATEATALIHGRAAADKAAETARQTFEAGQLTEDLPTVDIPAAELAARPAVFALLTKAGLTKSNGEGRRLIKGGGVSLNGTPVRDETRTAGPEDVTDGVLKLSVGKKRHVLLRPVG